jgi:hypothetical protein
MRLREALGRGIGGLLSPIVAEGSLIRGARLVHAAGVVHRAEVRAILHEGPLGELAGRLAGPAIVRFSGALFRVEPGRALPDILGVAVRFGAAPAPTQDLLFASFQSVWQLPLALFSTNTRDVLANDYDTVLPSDVPGLSRVTFRLHPSRVTVPGGDRWQKLDRAVAEGAAVLELQARQVDPDTSWQVLAAIDVRERLDVDQEALAFDPFHDGLGIVPRGFLQATRAATYWASRLGRALAHGRGPITPAPIADEGSTATATPAPAPKARRGK